jgi:hypothetical protein
MGGGDLVRRRATTWRGDGDPIGRVRRFGGDLEVGTDPRDTAEVAARRKAEARRKADG